VLVKALLVIYSYGYDFTRESVIIDEDQVHEKIETEIAKFSDLVFIEGHTAEFVPKDFVKHTIVLRCNPGILRSRLEISRNYTADKIKENIQAEIMDECFLNLTQLYSIERITEIDTTNISPSEIVEKIIALTSTLK
jgi:adenylate kinase